MILRSAIACLAAVWVVSVSAEEATTKPAVAPKPAAATKPAATTTPAVPSEVVAPPAADALTNTVDPFDTADQKIKFLRAAGKTSELDAEVFETDRKTGNHLVMPFEKWATAVAFDKNKNGKLDWFEFEAYRQAMRAAVLAGFDKNKDGKLTGAERDAAIKALQDGKVTIKPGVEAPRGALPPTPDDPWGDNQRSRPPRVSRPLETSGLSDETIRNIKKLIPNAVAVDMQDVTRSADRRYLTIGLYCDDGKTRAVMVPEKKEVICKMHLDTQPAPLREFFLRQFDAGGDRKLTDEEWNAYETFDDNLAKTMNGWMSLMFDKDTTQAERHEALTAVGPKIDLGVNQRAGRDILPPKNEDEDDDEDMAAFYEKVNVGMVRYMERFEKRALADNGGKPNAATRAALLKALDADIRDRAEKIGMNNGKLTPENSAKLFLELTDEWLKEE